MSTALSLITQNKAIKFKILFTTCLQLNFLKRCDRLVKGANAY